MPLVCNCTGREYGDGREWCSDCSEWCYPEIPCLRCARTRLVAFMYEGRMSY